MVTEEIYSDIVQQHFNYLVQHYGFSRCPEEEHSRALLIAYCKGELIVKVEYSHTNTTIDVTIYNHTSVVLPGMYSWRYSVTLAHLLKRDLPRFNYQRDYKALMPTNLSLAESVKTIAALFRKHAAKIISGEEWVSWSELTGYSQYVPPELL